MPRDAGVPDCAGEQEDVPGDEDDFHFLGAINVYGEDRSDQNNS